MKSLLSKKLYDIRQHFLRNSAILNEKKFIYQARVPLEYNSQDSKKGSFIKVYS